MDHPSITNQEFTRFQSLIYKIAGIQMAESKKVLLVGRLTKRLKHYNLENFGDYYNLVTGKGQDAELQMMVDLLTTNETYFFREPKHFEYLDSEILTKVKPGSSFAIWSAACSSGEEPYTLSMVLADRFGEGPWQITASDISTAVLARAKTGLYPMERTKGISRPHLQKYCLKGTRTQEGSFMISKKLRERIRFLQVNLNAPLPDIGPFDVIFLRNVMIYFDMDTKRQVVANLITKLKPGGYFIVGHSETLNGITDKLQAIKPTIYRKS